jgi:hypothetical protein
MIVFVLGMRPFSDFVQVFSTGDGDDFKRYAYKMLNLKVNGITIAHADEDELNELFKQIEIYSVVHKVELKAAIASWRGDAWQSMHSLEKGRLRHQAAAAHDAEDGSWKLHFFRRFPKAIIFDAQALRASGYDLQAMKTKGYDAASLRAAGYELSSFLKVCYSAAELKRAGFAEDLGVATYRAAGCSWADVKTAGFTAAEARAAGCDWVTIRRANFTAREARAAGCDWVTIGANFTALEAIAAGCDPKNAVDAGYDPASLKAAGFGISVFKASGCDWAIIRRANFTAYEAKAAGCDAASAHSAGYDLSSLKDAGYDGNSISRLFGLDAAIAAGCNVNFVLVT